MLVAVLLACAAARAGDVWTGGAANTNVTTAANWSDGGLPTLTGGSSALSFATSGTLATLDTPVDIARLFFNATPLFSPLSPSRTYVPSTGSPLVETAPPTTAFTIGGTSSLTLRGAAGVGLVAGPSSALPNVSYRLSAPVTLANTQSWQVGTGAVGTSLVVDGPISGSGGLNLIGSGAVILTQSNSYSGGTTITSGTLQLGNGGAAASVEGGIVNNATLAFGNGLGSAAHVTNQISGTGDLVVQGNGPVLLANAANTFSGGVVASGQLIVTDAAALGTGTSAIVVRGFQEPVPGSGFLRFVSPSSGLALTRAIALTGTDRMPGRGSTYEYYRPMTGGVATVGDVTLGSTITSASSSIMYRVGATFGTLTLTGTVAPQASSRLGLSNAVVTGRVIGSGTLAVVGGGGVTLTNTTNSIGVIQMRSGRLRVASGAALSGTVTWSQQGDDATLEIRTSAANATSFAPLVATAPSQGFVGGIGTTC